MSYDNDIINESINNNQRGNARERDFMGQKKIHSRIQSTINAYHVHNTDIDISTSLTS
jgi:hypothetical protein